MDSNTPASQAPVAQVPVPQAPTSVPFDGPIELLKFGWNTFTKHWKKLSLIILVPFVIYAVGVLIFIGATVSGLFIGGIVAFIAIVAAYVFFIAAVLAIISAIHKIHIDPGTPITVKGLYRQAFSSFWPFVLLLIVAGFVNMGSLALLFIPGIFVIVSCSLYMFTFTIDGKRHFNALVESYNLVRGRWWRVFGRLLFGLLIVFVAYLVMILISFLLSSLPNVLIAIIDIIIGFVFVVFCALFGLGYMYRLYVTLKSTRLPAPSGSTFKGWLIAFLCVGAITPVGASILGLSSIVLVSLNSARMKATDAQNNANTQMMEIQRQIDAENLQMQQNQPNTSAQQ
jgi:hypothetical protein